MGDGAYYKGEGIKMSGSEPVTLSMTLLQGTMVPSAASSSEMSASYVPLAGFRMGVQVKGTF